jgi:hypothetical protein
MIWADRIGLVLCIALVAWFAYAYPSEQRAEAAKVAKVAEMSEHCREVKARPDGLDKQFEMTWICGPSEREVVAPSPGYLERIADPLSNIIML